jgi:hypothetical protein
VGVAGIVNSGITGEPTVPYKLAGTISTLYVRVITNDRTATSSVTVRKNGADGNGTVSIAAVTTGEFEDNSGSDSIASDDNVNYKVIVGTGGTTLVIGIISSLFEASSNTTQACTVNASSNFSTASTTFFQPIWAGNVGNNSTTEADNQIQFRAAGTLQYYYFLVGTNARSTSTTVNVRLNGADVITVTVTASSTGEFEDNADSQAVVSGDLVCNGVTLGTGTGNFNHNSKNILFTTTDRTQQFGNSSIVPIVFNISTTTYHGVSGSILNTYTTESDMQADANVAMTVSKAECRVAANTVVGASTLKLRINGANGNNSVSITGSTTGWFEDASNTDSVVATDEINYQLITDTVGTSLSISAMGALATYAVNMDTWFRQTVGRVPVKNEVVAYG